MNSKHVVEFTKVITSKFIYVFGELRYHMCELRYHICELRYHICELRYHICELRYVLDLYFKMSLCTNNRDINILL
jgi:hypothetical protein